MKKLLIALALLPAAASVQNAGPYRGPIIDVHLHAPGRIMKGISVDAPSTFMKPQDLDRLASSRRTPSC